MPKVNNAAPAAPVIPSAEKPTVEIPETVTHASLLVMKDADVFQLAKRGYVARGDALEKATAKFTDCLKAGGKICARIRRIFLDRRASGTLTSDTKFEKFCADNTGAAPHHKVGQYANVFATLVETGLIPETTYDKLPGQLIEGAAPLVKRAGEECGGDTEKIKAHETILKVVDALTKATAPGEPDAKEQLKEMRNAQKDADAKDAGETPEEKPAAVTGRVFNLATTEGLLAAIAAIGAECANFTDAPNLERLLKQAALFGEMLEGNALVAAFQKAQVAALKAGRKAGVAKLAVA